MYVDFFARGSTLEARVSGEMAMLTFDKSVSGSRDFIQDKITIFATIENAQAVYDTLGAFLREQRLWAKIQNVARCEKMLAECTDALSDDPENLTLQINRDTADLRYQQAIENMTPEEIDSLSNPPVVQTQLD